MPKNEVIYNRSVPYNTEAEMFVLGGIFIDNSIIDSTNGKLFEEDFFDERHQKIYAAMLALKDLKKPIEILTVVEQLKTLNYPEADNIKPYLIELMDTVPSTAKISNFISIVEDKAIERKLLHKMQDLCDDILNHKYEVNDMLDNVDVSIKNIIRLRKTSVFKPIDQAASELYEKIKAYSGQNRELTGLDTGFPGLNKTLLGLQPGDFMILAARPSVGKSAYAINLALNISKKNNAHVAFFSLEMSVDQLMMRIFALQAGLPLGNIRNGNLTPQELLLLGIARDDLANYHLYFDENASSNFADIRLKCRQLKQAGKLDFVVIDYLQLITVANSKGNRQEEVSQISRQLKTLAQELEVPILALSQLSRSVEGRENKTPQLSDLRESGSIEQDADVVMFLYRRSDVEGKNTADELNEEVNKRSGVTSERPEMQELVLSILKNRQGALKDFDYHFYGHLTRFTEQPQFRPLIPKKEQARQNNGMKNLKQ